MKRQFRQGDVLIERIENIPDAAKQVKAKKIILAHGEATGHAHTIDRNSADWWVLPARGDLQEAQFLDVADYAAVVHQEHAPIVLPAGKYRVTRQREYSPEAIRNVAD